MVPMGGEEPGVEADEGWLEDACDLGAKGAAVIGEGAGERGALGVAMERACNCVEEFIRLTTLSVTESVSTLIITASAPRSSITDPASKNKPPMSVDIAPS